MAASLGSDSRRFVDQGLQTTTSVEQHKCEEACAPYLIPFDELDEEEQQDLIRQGIFSRTGQPLLMREAHIEYLRNGLNRLPRALTALDASQIWLTYWSIHGLNVLGAPQPELCDGAVDLIARCQNEGGGFGGGPQQVSHAASTYAAILALASTGMRSALSVVRRGALYRWLLSMKREDGPFRMHADGEVDTRSVYTAVCTARIANILTPELVGGAAEYLLRCQTYEGGFGGEPGNEAHGGYTFCALAGLILLGRAHECNLPALQRWVCARQMPFSGGFQGRANKLVDGCYSFWQGGCTVLLAELAKGKVGALAHWISEEDAAAGAAAPAGPRTSLCASRLSPVCLMDAEALQRYVQLCAQLIRGGLRDKPEMGRDRYHTCYCLSGLSCAQHFGNAVLGQEDRNRVAEVDPVANVCVLQMRDALAHFAALPCSHEALVAE